MTPCNLIPMVTFKVPGNYMLVINKLVLHYWFHIPFKLLQVANTQLYLSARGVAPKTSSRHHISKEGWGSFHFMRTAIASLCNRITPQSLCYVQHCVFISVLGVAGQSRNIYRAKLPPLDRHVINNPF